MSEQYFGVDSTCLECAILRAHILNLERELAEARDIYISQNAHLKRICREATKKDAVLAALHEGRSAEYELLRETFEKLAEEHAALAALRDENATMINAAGCALGTDEALRSAACVEVLARQTEALRGELIALRQRHAEAVEQAYMEALALSRPEEEEGYYDGLAIDAWLASEAKARLT
jgi:hypothetical protein